MRFQQDPARAAERECLEECGLQVRAVRLLDVMGEQEHPAGAHILIAYRGEIAGGLLQAGDDAAAAGFFSRQDLPALAFQSTRGDHVATAGSTIRVTDRAVAQTMVRRDLIAQGPVA